MESVNENSTTRPKEHKSLIDYLSEGLDSYFNNSDVANISKVSFNTDITRKTIRRIYDGEADLKRIEPIKLLKIYLLVTHLHPITPTKEHFDDFLNHFKDEIDTSKSSTIFQEQKSLWDTDFEGHLTTQERFDLAMLMKTQERSLLTKEQILHKGGQKYLDAAEGLARDGLFVAEGDCFYLNKKFEEGFSTLSKQTIAQMFPEMLKNTASFTPDGNDERPSTAFGIVKGWNEETIKKLKAKEKEFFNFVMKLEEDESNLGNIPYGLCYSSCSLVDNVQEFNTKGHGEVLQ